MSIASDKHERYVADYLNGLPGVGAVRPVVGTSYSDVKVNYRDKEAWLEVKMTHKDNLANPRVYYHQNEWKTKYSTPVAGIIVSHLNKCTSSLDFVYRVSEYSGVCPKSVYIPTNKSEMEAENAIPRDLMRRFCKANGSYILDRQNIDITDLVLSHYNHGKTEPVYYMQAGDDFYLLSNTNPLGLPSNIPQFNGVGKMRVRVSNRSTFYEVQAEIKVQSISPSDYSVLPGSNKINPFL